MIWCFMWRLLLATIPLLINYVGVASESVPFINLPSSTFLRGRTVPKDYDVQQTVSLARNTYSQLSSGDLEDRLAVMVVFNFPLYQNGTHPRLASLLCSLNMLQTNLGQQTPVDVFLWMNATYAARLPTWFMDTFPELIVLPIDEDAWRVPTISPKEEQWSSYTFTESSLNYHLMGRWRMTFGFDFVKALGYRYVLQMDDDAYMLAPYEGNLVQTFRENRIAFGRRDRVFVEKVEVVAGLPEMVKLWMVTRNYLEPAGPLLSHFEGGNISAVAGERWDRHLASASFMVWDVDFWFEPAVQDFLNLAFATGGDLVHRWLEQGLQNMIVMLFLPDENVHLFHQNSVMHQKVSDAATFRLMRCDTVRSRHVVPPGGTGLKDGRDQLPAYVLQDKVWQIQTIEFLAAWEVHVICPERQDFTSFRWRYNSSGCGADSHLLNDYWGFREVLNTTSALWKELEMDAIYSDLNATDIMPQEEQVRRGNMVLSTGSVERAECVAVLREQLRRFVPFYCRAMATDMGRRLEQMCNGMLASALAHFAAQQKQQELLE